nr:glycosyltransferase family 2 protein [uncultured Macellibacteroides sp.]
MYIVTIAIPLYNAESYIKNTLLSAFLQSFKSIEYLIIDDRGTDNSINIVHELQLTHPRGKDIRIITHEKNYGVAVARNTAINEANSEYLYFLDSDDTIVPSCIELLYNKLKKENTEIVIASFMRYSGNQKKDSTIFLDKVFRGRYQLANSYVSSKITSVWNILFDLSFLKEKGIMFQEVTKFEDIIFMTELIPLIDSCVLMSNYTYIYNIRENSLCQYNEREIIPLSEIIDDLQVRRIMKQICITNKKMPYIGNLCRSVMKRNFEAGIAIIQKRNLIVPKVTDSVIKDILSHPFSLKEIFCLKSNRLFNVISWLLGNTPCWILSILSSTYIRYKKIRSKT